MATIDELKTQLPAGFRIVEEDDYKVKASAANDLVRHKKELKDIVGDLSLDEVRSVLSEYPKLKKSQQVSADEELVKINRKVEKLLAEKENISTELKKTKLQMLLQKRIESVGKKLSDKFINFDELYKIDLEGGSGDGIAKQIDSLLEVSYKEQSSFLKEFGSMPADLPINFNVGGGRGKTDNRTPDVIDQLNKKLAEVASSFGAQYVGIRPPDSQKK